ncbi:hypothetical protein GKO48_03420 [Candidatus Lucifugimonas marina]|uniref:Excalibur calcium-binding domain-containing protein n=1 Tax=Candidatus Lucifugimonas marina TaxID=3038979 RepID=A0AAJ5ZLB9_9CHLR|nr:hypothetical protein GKO48_03420 [SAR202 cluster bacterium JH1073]
MCLDREDKILSPRGEGVIREGSDYDPTGPDRDCGDFTTWKEANDFFIAAGGPKSDPHRLDGDHDGVPCQTLR